MAIIKRTDTETRPASTLADGPIGMHEAPAPPAPEPPPAPPTPAGESGVRSMTETLPEALEPELRRIIDTAVARVAAIELEAIREARELTQRSEEEARQALAFALDRAFNLINTLELLAATVSGMAEALRIELDDAIDALRNVPQPESELAKELKQRKEASAQQAVPPPAEAAPSPQPEPAAPSPEPAPPAEPAPAAAEQSAPEPSAPEPQSVADAAPAEPEKPETVNLDAVKDGERETAAAEAPEQVAAAVSRGNGYPPAERQAESLAAAADSDPQPERPKTVIRWPESGDRRPAVPARRRGLIRRLFAK